MLLFALQTTSGASDESRLDTLTLVLVVVFIASMAAVTVLMLRRTQESTDEVPAPLPAERDVPVMHPPAESPERIRPPERLVERSPVWLQGVKFPAAGGSVAEASRMIEELLAARRDRNLARGVALYSPALLTRFRNELGVEESLLANALEEAAFTGEPPELRSVEVLDASPAKMSVRAGYSDRTSETFRLVWLNGRWLIDGIEQR